MIDPNIALSYRPTDLGIDTPTQVMTSTQQLSNLQQVGKMEQAQTTGLTQENDARALQMKTAAATNAAIAANAKPDANGNVVIDHAGVVKTLSQNGMGLAAQQYQDAQTKRDQDLAKLTGDQLTNAAKQHQMIESALGSVIGLKDPAARQKAWDEQVKFAYDNKLAAKGTLSPTPPDDATLQTMLWSSMDGQQQIQERLAQQNAASAEKRADAAETKSDAYMDYVTGKNQPKQAVFTKQYDKDNHPIMQGPDGKLYVDTSVTGAPYTDSTTGKDRKVTPDAMLADRRANEKDYETQAGAEIKARQEAQALQTALSDGRGYVDEKGKYKSFSSMKRTDGQDLTDDDKAAYVQDMKQRLAVSQNAIETAVSNKNNAMQRNGVTPQVSTQQAINAYRGQGAQQKPPANVIAQMQVGKVTTFKNGQKWMKNQDGSVKQVTQ
jgi:hypothetical protein